MRPCFCAGSQCGHGYVIDEVGDIGGGDAVGLGNGKDSEVRIVAINALHHARSLPGEGIFGRGRCCQLSLPEGIVCFQLVKKKAANGMASVTGSASMSGRMLSACWGLS